MFDDAIALRAELNTHWIVTLKVIGPFDNDVILHCYKFKYIKGKGVVVSGYSVPFYEEYDGEDIFAPTKDIYMIEKVTYSETYGMKSEKVCFDNAWKDEMDRMLDRMERRTWYGSVR